MSNFILNNILLIFTFLVINSKEISELLISKELIKSIKTNKDFRKLDTTTNNSKEKIITCNIKHCYECDKPNKCIKCKKSFILLNNHCYNSNCQIFGFCDYCDDFDCIQCKKGYQLNFGTCDKEVNGFKKQIIFFVLIPIVIFAGLLYLYIYIKKRNRKIIETGKVINLKHPKPGNYIILPETFREEQSPESFSKSSNLTSYESTDDGDINGCIVCGKKKVYAFGDCGCGLCKEHWRFIKNGTNEKIMCRKHGTQLKSIIFSLDNISNLKGNAVDKLGLKKCPICKTNNGTQSFNCKCNMKLCEKCFNEYVYILKYTQCPGCGMDYNPNKDKGNGFRFGKKKIKDNNINNEESEIDRDMTQSTSSKNI